MANYNKSNKKNIPAKKTPIATPKKPAAKTSQGLIANPSTSKITYFTAFMIIICGILLYANTSNHSYVLDDFSVIAENKMTKGGVDSLGAIFRDGYRAGNYTVNDNLYRPFTKAMFAVEYDVSGGQPSLSHWVNILLYGFLCGFIFLSLLKFFPGQYYLALIAALLFTFHPIHTEVVANIKSRDEILTLFFLIGSLRCAHNYLNTHKYVWIGGAGVLYMLALITKESAITYMALLPISMYFITKASWSKIGIVTGAMLVVTFIYLYIHWKVIGMIGLPQSAIPVADNSLNIKGAPMMQKEMTAIYILGLYLKLMFFPHPLSCDYSFDTIPMVTSPAHIGFLCALLIHVGLLVYAVSGFRKKLVSSYAIFFYFITISIVSNMFTLIGTNMAERLVFMPSLGFCLLIAFFVNQLLQSDKLVPATVGEIFSKKVSIWFLLVPILIVATGKTYSRNQDWKTGSTLFNADIKTVPNSVHMMWYHAGMITNSDSLAIKDPEARMKTLLIAEEELVRAKNKLPEFANAHSELGKVYRGMAEYYNQKQQGAVAQQYYRKALVEYATMVADVNQKDPTAFNNYATCYFSLGKMDSAEIYFKKAIELKKDYPDALANLGSVYGMYGASYMAQNKKDEGLKFFNMAIAEFNKALLYDKENLQAYQFLGVTYLNMGDSVKAIPYTQKYNELLQKKTERLNGFKKGNGGK
jgi:Flp pilus assembly protein TadD